MTSTVTVLAEREAAFSLFDGLTLRSDISWHHLRGYERPFTAPAAAQAPLCARALMAAFAEQTRDEGSCVSAASAAKRPNKRARGLQTWRDPA